MPNDRPLRLPFDEWVLPGVRYRSLAGDITAAVLLAAAGVAAWFFADVRAWVLPLDAIDIVWLWPIVAVSVVVALSKRRMPEAAVALAAAQLVAIALASEPLLMLPLVAMVDALYAAMLYASPRGRAIVYACVITAGIVQARPVFSAESVGEVIAVVIAVTLFNGAPLLWGTAVRQRDELLTAEKDRADAIARAAEAERAAAVRAERTEVAGELHDEIAARLTAISLQASAMSSRVDDDPALTRAVTAMRTSSHEALSELHQLIGVLAQDRADDGTAADVPDEPHGRVDGTRAGNADGRPTAHDPQAAMRAQAEAFGVELTLAGDPGTLSTPVSNALERIGREAIANAAKHAPGAPIDARFDRGDRTIGITIDNPLPSRPEHAQGSGLGTELMAARWLTLGGTGHIGAEHGLWRVRVEIPLGADLSA
ncbi:MULTISPECIES: sensor histidine kinase [unclassified Microbacterium]|nr:histidine kinase [Microbacterium sp. JB110]RCS60405.1 hypothetical protein CIK77_10460 [Microbacterium sp. JB110]SJM49572.1 putative two-component system sensor kinase [Frigoribacterium sp. JB110]